MLEGFVVRVPRVPLRVVILENRVGRLDANMLAQNTLNGPLVQVGRHLTIPRPFQILPQHDAALGNARTQIHHTTRIDSVLLPAGFHELGLSSLACSPKVAADSVLAQMLPRFVARGDVSHLVINNDVNILLEVVRG